MSERKPPGVSWQSWVDRQIEEAAKDGAFDELEGHGQPIRDLDRPHDDDWWIRAKLAREEVLVTPPTIAIRHDRDTSIERAMDSVDEAAVRAIVDDLNDRIRAVNRTATWGPPSSVAPLDPEAVVVRWRTTGRGARADEPIEGFTTEPGADRLHESGRERRRSARLFRRRRAG